MTKGISKYIYYSLALTLIIIGVIVKYFLIDIDLGARFKNYNRELLSSDIIFIVAVMLIIIGFIFRTIKRNKKSTLNDSTVIISALLIIPITIVLALTPFLMTYLPGKTGDSILSSSVSTLAIIGSFATFAWIILLVVTFIKQTIIILTNKTER